MRTRRSVRRALLVLGVAGICAGAGPGSTSLLQVGSTTLPQAGSTGSLQATKPSDDEVGRLRAEVKELKEHKEDLEREVTMLRGNLDAMRAALLAQKARMVQVPQFAPGTFDLQPRSGTGEAVPPGAQQRSFNGITYYMMPLGRTQYSEKREAAAPLITPDPKMAPVEIGVIGR